ncbi:MAG: hypothetical protein QOI80_2211, partial [Solirubrobacteraceae bacterium]|nr:hypothetical protein [Solirubrobacteraceae bacterium]
MIGERRTRSLNGLAVARELLLHGLSVDGHIVQGDEDEDIVRWRIGRRQTFALRHPDYVDHVLHDGADRYHKSIEYELLRAVLGLNLFNDEDESWRRHRMLLNPVMAKRHVRGMCDLMIAPIAEFLDEYDDDRDQVEIEMAGAMTALTLDVVGAALFGHQFGDMARRMKTVVTSGLRAAEVATRLLMVFAPPVWSMRLFAAALERAPLLPPPLDQVQWVMRTVDKTVWEV